MLPLAVLDPARPFSAKSPVYPIRAELRRVLAHRIITGELAGDHSLRPVELAREFGVSPTPMREALIELVRDGFLELSPNRGFFVRPLDATEVRELYPLICTLEASALRSRPPSDAQLTNLDRINRRFAQAVSPEDRVANDTEWHRMLLAHHDNQTLREIVSALRGRLHRYEIAYMREFDTVSRSVRQHQEIVRALRRGETRRALQLLEKNWRQAVGVLVPWLESRGSTLPARPSSSEE